MCGYVHNCFTRLFVTTFCIYILHIFKPHLQYFATVPCESGILSISVVQFDSISTACLDVCEDWLQMDWLQMDWLQTLFVI